MPGFQDMPDMKYPKEASVVCYCKDLYVQIPYPSILFLGVTFESLSLGRHFTLQYPWPGIRLLRFDASCSLLMPGMDNTRSGLSYLGFALSVEYLVTAAVIVH